MKLATVLLLVPPDKKLDPVWVKSLTGWGNPQVCAGAELTHIGMPVGGLFAGQSPDLNLKP